SAPLGRRSASSQTPLHREDARAHLSISKTLIDRSTGQAVENRDDTEAPQVRQDPPDRRGARRPFPRSVSDLSTRGVVRQYGGCPSSSGKGDKRCSSTGRSRLFRWQGSRLWRWRPARKELALQP